MSQQPTDFRVPSTLPKTLPIMALIRGVLLPGTFAPFNVGRASSLAALKESSSGLILIAGQNTPVREPSSGDLMTTATLARVVRSQRKNGGRFVLVQGLARVQLSNITQSSTHFTSEFELVASPWPSTSEGTAMDQALREAVAEMKDLLAESGKGVSRFDRMKDAGLLTDALAGALDEGDAFKREILCTLDPMVRAERVLQALLQTQEVLEVKQSIRNRLANGSKDRQREAILRQQLQAIQEELGQDGGDEISELRGRLDTLELPEEAREAVEKEFSRLGRIPQGSPERSTSIDWLTRVADLPWNTFSADDVDFDLLEQELEDSHYGLDDVKRQVVEYLSVRKLRGEGRADVLLLVGPPGVGKTSIGEVIAQATGRKLVRVALGGVRDEAELRGHRRTYVGARPGRLIEGFRRAGTADPVVLLDEIDKLGRSHMGDPSSALLEILDPEQNHQFVDHYLEVPFDLSRAIFIATANDLSSIPAPLRSRMDILDISGYTPAEKHVIGRKFLMPRAAKAAGMLPEDVELDDLALADLIDGWTREAGVRQLQRALGKLYRAAAVNKARGRHEGPLAITADDLPTYLKRRKYQQAEHDLTGRPGIATGLAWTPVGGDVLYVEASTLPGPGNLVLTGQLGDVMKESARAALTYVLSHRAALGIPGTGALEHNVHIHVPAGAVPKDGPSAGVTMFTALASLLSGRSVRTDVAMTGEATLRGRVLAVGGIKSKVLAAHQRGLRTVILPKQNARDLDEIPADVRAELDIHLVETMDEALHVALEPLVPDVDNASAVQVLT